MKRFLVTPVPGYALATLKAELRFANLSEIEYADGFSALAFKGSDDDAKRVRKMSKVASVAEAPAEIAGDARR
jgi:hypothetical protein